MLGQTMTTSGIELRFAISDDHYSMIEVEREAFGALARPLDVLREKIAQRGAFAMVAEDVRYQRVVGYMVFTIGPKQYTLDELLVAPRYRWLGVGRSLVDHLIERMLKSHRASIVAAVRERNLPLQCFLKGRGFKWTATLNRGTDDESYQMVYEKPNTPPQECQGR